MKFTAPSAALTAATTLAKRIAAKSFPQSAVLIEGPRLTLHAADGTLGLRQVLDAPCEGEPIMVDAATLARVCSHFVGETRAALDGPSLKLAAGKRKAELEIAGHDGYRVPDAPAGGFEVDATALREAIDRVRHAASEDAARPALCSVRVEIIAGRVRASAVDGMTLAIYGDTTAPLAAVAALIPGPMLPVLRELLTEGTVRVVSTERTLWVASPTWALSHGAPEGTLPAVPPLVPAGRTIAIHADRDAFVGELSTAHVFAEGKDSTVVLGVEGETVTFTSGGDSARKSRSELDATVQPSDAKVRYGVNSNQLLAMLRSLPAGPVVLTLTGTELDPFVLEPGDGSGLLLATAVRV